MNEKNIITIEDLEAGRVDFSDLSTGELLPPVHPGAVLRLEFMEPLGLSTDHLAAALHVPTDVVAMIASEADAISAEMALRLARYFGTTARFWLSLQVSYDLRVAERTAGATITADVAPRANPAS